MTKPNLSGLRILIVEDEWVIADDTAEALARAGATIVGPIATVDAAMEQVRQDGFDVAVLDLKLQGEFACPVADVLKEQGVPFLFLTGYDRSMIPSRFADMTYCAKPHDLSHLTRLLHQMCSARNVHARTERLLSEQPGDLQRRGSSGPGSYGSC